MYSCIQLIFTAHYSKHDKVCNIELMCNNKAAKMPLDLKINGIKFTVPCTTASSQLNHKMFSIHTCHLLECYQMLQGLTLHLTVDVNNAAAISPLSNQSDTPVTGLPMMANTR